MNAINRQIHPEIRVLDEAQGLVEYVASDETLDHYREIIKADGWKFNYFKKNAPFVDSHNYETIDRLLGTVVDFRVEGKRLIETVKWAKEVVENTLARVGFAMTQAGHLKAVSVGFIPTKYVDQWTNGGADLAREALSMGLAADVSSKVRTIFLEQEQIELSACIIGANPSALAKAYKDGAVEDKDLDAIYQKISADIEKQTAREAERAAAAARAEEQQRQWLRKFETIINGEKS
jgi:hypothetical protein